MIYTSGIVTDLTREETLEELQDNKLKFVCKKLDLQPSDRLLDIGCGWGTLSAFAAKNYSCDVTGITLGKNQTKFGNDRIKANGLDIIRRLSRLRWLRYAHSPLHFISRIHNLTSTSVSAAMTLSSAKSMTSLTTTVSSSSRSPVSAHTGSSRTSSGASL
jgi:2-polyprenyl-3-methyl-5-hydroxy-6-metoxy-1,4-benzoquinol methylase